MSEKLKTTQPILVKDLREGKYKAVPARVFSGNIFLSGDVFYEVQNSGAWKRVNNPDNIQVA